MIVSNIGTARAAADMLLGGKPLTRRIVTVTGCVKESANYLVPIGTSVKELIEQSGGVTEKKNRIIAGGPMTGPCAASDWDGQSELFYVTKNTSGVLVLPDSKWEEQPWHPLQRMCQCLSGRSCAVSDRICLPGGGL